jgi:HAE1 family hydrophobic/amphiphilic exporter-1
MACAALLVGGVFAFLRLPLDLAPAVEFPSLTISTRWGNASAETVEMFVTAPIEEIVQTVRGVRRVTSRSQEGRSSVNVAFESNTNMSFARLELYEKLAALGETLPPGVGTPILQPYVPEDLRDLQGFLSYSLAGPVHASELKRYAQEHIVPRLLTIRGVSKVEVFGGEERELQVELNALRLAALGVTVDNVLEAMRDASFALSAGAIQSSHTRLVVTVNSPLRSVAELEQISLRLSTSLQPLSLADVGIVREGISERRNFYRINGKPSVTLVIDKEQGVNVLRLAQQVYDHCGEIAATFPHEFELVKESDKSERMQQELDRLYSEILFSLLCIWLVLFAFLGDVRAPLILLSSIAFSVAGTFVVLWMLGIGLNLFTMAGLVLGFGRLVDDAIVVMDNIRRKTTERMDAESLALGVNEITLPVVASTITTVGALVPVAFLPDDLKPYFVHFGIAVGVSLLFSLLVSLTLIPSVMYRTRMRESHPFASVGEQANKLYRFMLMWALGHRKTVVLLAIWMFGVPIWLLPERIESESWWADAYNATLGSGTFNSARPYLHPLLGTSSYLFFTKVTKGELWEWGSETYLIARVGFPQGTEIERYDDVADRIERLALQFEELKKITTRVVDDHAVVRIDFSDATAMTSLPYLVKERLTLFAAQTGGATISVAGFGPGFYTGGESAPNFYVKVLGYNYNEVKRIAQQFQERIERNPRIAEVDIDRSFGRWTRSHELVATLDRDAIAHHGLTAQDVVQNVRRYGGGVLDWNTLPLSDERQNRVPYTVRFAGYRDFSVDDLRGAVVVSSSGEPVRLLDLMSVEQRRVQSSILREDQQYVRYIGFEYRGPYRYGDAFVDAVIREMPLPPGYRFDREGIWFRFTEAAGVHFLWIAMLALLIVFMVTAALYESFVKPFIVILSVPLSLVGMFLAFYLTDTPFGRGGYASLILLVGIVVSNAIILVDYISRRMREQGAFIETVADAASHRLRPVMMTTLTTIGGLLPLLALSAKTSIWYSLALGTIGGLASSALLTLIVIPVAYVLVSRSTRTSRRGVE